MIMGIPSNECHLSLQLLHQKKSSFFILLIAVFIIFSGTAVPVLASTEYSVFNSGLSFW